ncbi:MAG TPA: acetyl-CoA hydrolase/transferase C-terminal domain-containing protein [Chloroflexia bacterium]|nr:acetyl-CoA hydrolase/transferase C-terminal domain-containing protein [Chloroflexia bacterium]
MNTIAKDGPATEEPEAYMEGRPAGTAQQMPRIDLPWTAYAAPLRTWPAQFHNKLFTPSDALQAVHSHQRVYIGGGCGEPLVLAQELVRRAGSVREVEIIQILTAGHAAYAAPELAAAFRVNALFIGANVRGAVHAGRADYTPVCLSEIPHLFREGYLPIDVALISVSPPDARGYCSYGVEVGVTKAAVESARLVIAEINPHMPRVWGDSFIHLNQIDRAVLVNYPLPEQPQSRPSPVYAAIGHQIATLIEDGATLQLGIGAIPDAVLPCLVDKRDLGVHSEMVSDGIIDLVDAGVITNRRKTLLPGKIVTSFLLGSRRLYEFAHDNPMLELHPTEFTNDPFIISRNDRMVAINSALQIDLTGQVCADSLGTRFYSGVGGQADFMRGAARSQGGKPIIALPATALNGQVSRIVGVLDAGAGVTTTRHDVHYVVTEYGVAALYGKTARQRAKALIAIAHPDFRAALHETAVAHGLA